DIEVDAVKIGMVSQIETIRAISEKLKYYQPKNIVLDPVMISKSGYDLLKPDAKDALIKNLLPLATIVTPNIPEAENITEMSIQNLGDMEKAAKLITKMGAKNVLLKGGHLATDATDLLYDGKNIKVFKTERIHTKNTHGTGCTLSSAIASNLAKGYSIEKSVESAKKYITIAIKHSLSIGKGVGPTHHFYTLYANAGLLSEGEMD
ncbi:MAG: bifunctional hydroxymethylpyrimidine kinase/phosphomethylpyrimidine kinase, partial [Desulfobacterales bacterium]|nr:bifunctional hydroxymethylpyrimidine kinase/phosphomethylpyrimidine kinase [Desulfobacterales bacterium]